jgi:hypothetical protein
MSFSDVSHTNVEERENPTIMDAVLAAERLMAAITRSTSHALVLAVITALDTTHDLLVRYDEAVARHHPDLEGDPNGAV